MGRQYVGLWVGGLNGETEGTWERVTHGAGRGLISLIGSSKQAKFILGNRSSSNDGGGQGCRIQEEGERPGELLVIQGWSAPLREVW